MTPRRLDIRPGVPEDAAALAEFAERIYRDTFAPDNHPADMDAYCAKAFSTAIQERDLKDPSIHTLVGIDDGGALVAYAQLRPGAGPAITGPSPIELWRFYLARALHGSGAARPLMEAVLEAARARGARTLWLGVWERNPRAQAFYRKAGFVEVGAQEFLMGNDLQTDRLMVRSLDSMETHG
ncbi:MAG: GNAT family N-acetyltransferase [Acidobacteriota bacterium]